MSSGSESDEEFVPGEPEQLSEEESADDETDLQYQREVEYKNKKRKAAQENDNKKKRRTRAEVAEPDEEDEKVKELPEQLLDPVEEKKREDDLWAMFLEGTDTKPKASAQTKDNSTPTSSSTVDDCKNKLEVKPEKAKDDEKAREKRIFEFAGETIVVENNMIKEKIKSTDSRAAELKSSGPSRPRSSGMGLANVLGQLNKKNTLSTLEKSKLDWETLKKEEGIEEEVKNYNKGKNGFLERRDFLERADLRQYEIERELRMSRRSNR